MSILLKLSLFLHKMYGKSKSGKSSYVNPTVGDSNHINYAHEVVNDYLKLLKNQSSNLDILEVGTGANLLPALILSKKFKSVKSIDKYNCLNHSINLYNKSGLVDDIFTKSLNTFLTLRGKEFNYTNINYEETGLESIQEKNKFDVILSRAVFEHLDNPEESLKNMAKYLKENGEMIHEIDFRDHGIFTHFKLSPFYMYKIPDTAWRKSSIKNPGLPNRLTSFDFEILFKKYFPKHQIHKIVKEKLEINPIRLNNSVKRKYKNLDERVVVFHLYKNK